MQPKPIALIQRERMMRGQWVVRIICCQCSREHKLSVTPSVIANSMNQCCAGCGKRGDFTEIVSRWVSKETWWKPWTWGNGHWEDRHGDGDVHSSR